MNAKIDSLLEQIRQLEQEMTGENRKKEIEFCYKTVDQKVQFTAEASARHKTHRLGLPRFLIQSRFLVLLTAPVIWLCLVPMLLTDLIGSIYQAICFPIYGIPKVRRKEYLVFDRHRLTYLNFIEKLNCAYCAYVNGILAFFTEVAARTEQYWCPIKHAGCVNCVHSRYKKFVEFGDAEKYRERLNEIRHAYADVSSAAPPPR